MGSLVYFSHSYRPRDAVVNDYFARLMEAEGLVPSLDPPSVRVNAAKLERHLNYSDAMIVVLTERETGISPHIRYEIALGLKSRKPTLVFVEDTLPSDVIPPYVLQRRFSFRSFPRSIREHRQSLAILREYVGETPPPRYQESLTPRTCLLLGTSTIESATCQAVEDYIRNEKRYEVVSSADLLAELGQHPIAHAKLPEIDIVVAFCEKKMSSREMHLLGIIEGICKPSIIFAENDAIVRSTAVPVEYHPRSFVPGANRADLVAALATELEIYEEDFLELADTTSADRYTQLLIDLGGRGRYSSLTRERGVEVVMGDRYAVQGQVGAMGPNANAHDITFNQIWNQTMSKVDLPTLAAELARLRVTLRTRAETPDEDRIVADVGQAELSAKAGDGPAALRHLRSAGKWALGVATSIGVGMAVAAIKASTGL